MAERRWSWQYITGDETVGMTVAGYVAEHAGPYDFAAIVAEYRRQVAAALPVDFALAGEEFVGPFVDSAAVYAGQVDLLRGAVFSVSVTAVVRGLGGGR